MYLVRVSPSKSCSCTPFFEAFSHHCSALCSSVLCLKKTSVIGTITHPGYATPQNIWTSDSRGCSPYFSINVLCILTFSCKLKQFFQDELFLLHGSRKSYSRIEKSSNTSTHSCKKVWEVEEQQRRKRRKKEEEENNLVLWIYSSHRPAKKSLDIFFAWDFFVSPLSNVCPSFLPRPRRKGSFLGKHCSCYILCFLFVALRS